MTARVPLPAIRLAIAALTFAGLPLFPALGMAFRPRVRLDMENTGQGPLRFHAQASSFRDAGQRQRLEVSYAFNSDRLQILGDSGASTGGYSFSVIVFDHKGRQIAGDVVEKSFAAGAAAAARNRDRLMTGIVLLRVDPGRYRIAMTCRDANSQRSATLEKKMVMPDLGGDPAISTIRFERVVGVDTMPWPARRYGDVVTPLVAYFECYVHSPSGQRVRTRLWSLDDERVVWELWLGPLAVERSPYRLTIPADSIMNGSYELQASIEDSAGHVLASSAETLIIQNPHRLTRRDYQDRVDQLRYISRTHELDFLKQAPDSLRDSLWQQFWKGRDPTPGTDRNEAQDEYYERISFANQHYSVGIRPGWRTDMGQIYIRYGAPDEIERHPFDTDIPAYEIWYYYRDGHKFIFSDVQGFGEYRLTHPRNEKMR